MINNEIVNYVKIQRQKGQSDDSVKQSLLSAGWQVADIEEAFRVASGAIPASPAGNYASGFYQPGQAPAQLASFSDLLKEAWNIYKARYKTFLGILLVPVGIIILVILAIIFFGIILGVSNSASAVITAGPTPMPGNSSTAFSNVINFLLGFGIILFVFIIPIIVLQLWSQSALLFAIKDSAEGIGIKESYRRGWHKIGSVFWVGLLSGIIITGGYLFFVIPGVIFAIWFSLATFIVVSENIGGMTAILKSKEYIKGYGWEVFIRLIVMGLIVGGISIAFSLPGWLINMTAGATNSEALSVVGMLVQFAGNIVGFILAPLATIYTFLIYKNLRAIKGEIVLTPTSWDKIKYILVGLLGIIVVFGFIIGSIVLVSLSSARGKATDARRAADMQQVQAALMFYADDHNDMYPASLDDLTTEKMSYSNSAYIMILPLDPVTKKPYEYRRIKNGKDYELCAKLDSGGSKCLNKGLY